VTTAVNKYYYYYYYYCTTPLCPNIISDRTKNNVEIMANEYEFVLVKQIIFIQ